MTHDTTPAARGVSDDTVRRIAAQVAEILRGDLNAIVDRLDRLTRSGNLAQAFNDAYLAEAFSSEGRPAITRPDAATPRPLDIDRACTKAAKSGEPQRLTLDDYGITLTVDPGADAEQLWAGIIQMTCAGGSHSEVHRPRRAAGN